MIYREVVSAKTQESLNDITAGWGELLAKKSKVKSVALQVTDHESDDQITPQFRHIKELAKLKYDAEEKREQNLIQQSSQMQTVFSFMTIGLFMATPMCVMPPLVKTRF